MSRVRFGDVVRDVKLKVDRDNNPYEFYLAGEHFDSERLFIPRRGRFEGSDVGPAFIRIFKPGQVLYGSRRTYLKKVAVADFEGITANTTFVLESKDENVLMQGLLPFIMLSGDFTKWSIDHSKGSTNPYVLFSDLAEYEFELPPIEIQRKLSDLLREGEGLKEVYRRLLVACDELVKSRFVEMLEEFEDEVVLTRLEDIVEVNRPITYGIVKPGQNVDGGVPIVKVKDFPSGVILTDDLLYASPEIESKYERSRLLPGDLLFSIRGSVGRMAFVPEELEGANLTQDTARLTIRSEFDPIYIRGVLSLPQVDEWITKHIRGVAMQGVNLADLRKLEVPILSNEHQCELCAFVSQVDKSELCDEMAVAA